MLQDLNWETLESRRAKLQLVMIYKIINDLVDIPCDAYLTPATTRTSTGVIQKVLPVLSTETLLHIWLSTEYYGFRPSSTAVNTWDTRGLMMSK